MLADERYKEWLEAQRENPSDSLNAQLRAWFTALQLRLDSAALVAAGQAFAVSRIVLFAVTYLGMAFHPSIWGANHPASATFWDAWYQWDARWYVRVARSGYHFHDLYHWSSVAFFPLYPAIMRVLVIFIPVSTKLIAILVANLTFFLALYALHRLVQREIGCAIATRTVLYLSLFPTAMFFFAGYSESPFLLWTVLSISALRQQRWAMAGLWGFLAAATRSQGLMLVVPFAVECWSAQGRRWRQMTQLLWAAMIPLGWAVLALIMGSTFNNPLLFIESQRAWHRVAAWPWEGIWLTLSRIPLNGIASARPAHNLIELCSVLLFGALIALGWRALPRSFSLYALCSLAVILATPAILDGYYLPLMSTSRLCLAIFPCFITLAIKGEYEPLDRLVTTLGPALLALFAVIFLQGGWVA